MSVLASHILLLALAQTGGLDPAADCRRAHAADPQAHIACLERALQKESKTAPSEAAAELGGEQVRKRERVEPASVAAEIVEVGYTVEGLGVFRMADGQVWKETVQTPEALRLDAGQRYSARIERGTVGGYRMYVDGLRRALKVRRVQ